MYDFFQLKWLYHDFPNTELEYNNEPEAESEPCQIYLVSGIIITLRNKRIWPNIAQVTFKNITLMDAAECTTIHRIWPLSDVVCVCM